MGSRTSQVLVGAAVTALVLSGCGLVGGDERGPRRDGEPEWVLDQDSERYYRPDLVVHSTELVEEHFPVLDDLDTVTIAEGRFTDPHERVPIPAPDDYWWQAVIELDPSQVQELLTATAASGASDLGGAEAPEPVADEQLLAELVPTLEADLEDCADGWVDVMPALAQESGTNVSDAGDLLDLAVVCTDGTQLVTSARDM